ncbi:SIR2 family protein [Paenibacillus sp. EC2-1]|uniref:SIR2 family protein n=1 Tax=Paenibacillus sp. EC2-1 TaxID=3388665 RepID=UPI003BEED473
MDIEQKLSDHLKKFQSAPFLFIGSGFSRRYINLEDWPGLLRKFASFSATEFEYYLSSADGKLDEVAAALAQDFHPVWFQKDNYRQSRDDFRDNVIDRSSPLKIEISKYLHDKLYEFGKDESLDEEVLQLKDVCIDGIITTNWDLLLEQVFEDQEFFKYVGQKELLFSNPKEVAEIYKIHGCCTNPNSLVLTAHDYKDFNDRNPYLAAKLLTIFIEHPVIFIGYSLTDENIRKILESITACLTTENIGKLKDRLIFVERAHGAEDSVEDGSIVINQISLPLTRVKASSYTPVYRALTHFRRKYPAKVMRKMKDQIYELILTNDPKGQLHAALDLDSDTDPSKVEFFVGVGVAKKFGLKGYGSISSRELFEGIINGLEYDSKEIVLTTLPELLKSDQYVPVYRYVKESGLPTDELPPSVKKKTKFRYESFLTRTTKIKVDAIRSRYSNIQDLINNQAIHMVIENVILLDPKAIDVEELQLFISERISLLDSNNQSIVSNFRKLIRYYDWLVFS